MASDNENNNSSNIWFTLHTVRSFDVFTKPLLPGYLLGTVSFVQLFLGVFAVFMIFTLPRSGMYLELAGILAFCAYFGAFRGKRFGPAKTLIRFLSSLAAANGYRPKGRYDMTEDQWDAFKADRAAKGKIKKEERLVRTVKGLERAKLAKAGNNNNNNNAANKKKALKPKKPEKIMQDGRWYAALPFNMVESNPDPLAIMHQSNPQNIMKVIRKGSSDDDGEETPIELYFKASSPTSAAFEAMPLSSIEGVDMDALKGGLPLIFSETRYSYYYALRLTDNTVPLISQHESGKVAAMAPGGLPNPQLERLYDTFKDADLDIKDTLMAIIACKFNLAQHKGLLRRQATARRTQQRIDRFNKQHGDMMANIPAMNDRLMSEKLSKEPLYATEIIIATNNPQNLDKILAALPSSSASFKKARKVGKKYLDSLLARPVSRKRAISIMGNILSSLGMAMIFEKIILNVEELQAITRLPRNPMNYPFKMGLPTSRVVGLKVKEDESEEEVKE